MAISAIFWDIGGVINRTEDFKPRDELATELGVSIEYLNHLFFSGPKGTKAQLGQLSIEDLMLHIRRELDLEQDQYPDLLERFFAGDSIDEDLVDYVRQLQSRFKTGVISNAWNHLDDLLSEWGIKGSFDVVIGSGDVGFMKPNPEIYQLALRKLDVQPQEAVFIDDFIENIKGAQALGIHTIHFQNKAQAVEELERILVKENHPG